MPSPHDDLSRPAPSRKAHAWVADVPFAPPEILEEDIDAVAQVLRSGWITTGPVAADFEQALADFTGAGGVVLQNSCTSALEQALRVSGVGPGDEVIVPAYTYTATAAAALHIGATLVLVDSAPDRFVPDVEQVAELVTPSTKAIIAVDIGGIPYPVDKLRTALKGRGHSPNRYLLDGPVIISDAAHSLGAVLNGQRVGEIADLTAFSFHAVKNLTTAEGGALAWRDGLVEDNARFYQELREQSLHGQTKDAFAKDQPGAWEYDIVSPAFKSNMPDVLAALGLSQLRRYPDTLTRRRGLARAYRDALPPTIHIEPHESTEMASSAHLALTLLPPDLAADRDRIIQDMAEAGVTCNVHYKPLPLMSAYRNLGFRSSDYPNAVETFERTLTLPLFSAMSLPDVRRVAEALSETLGALGAPMPDTREERRNAGSPR